MIIKNSLKRYNRAHSMCGCTDLFSEIRKKCMESGIRTSVHDDFNPSTDKCKSVHGNPYILRGLLYKNGLFSSFFSYFFLFFTNFFQIFALRANLQYIF